MQRSLGQSTWKAVAELRVSTWSLQLILHTDLHLYPYIMTVVHELTVCRKQRRLEFAVWGEHEGVTMYGLQTHFHLDGIVNSKICAFGGKIMEDMCCRVIMNIAISVLEVV
jgi:hypothetical protein